MLGAMTGREMDATPADLKGVRYAVIENFRHDPAVSPGVARAFDAAVALLAASGGRRQDVELPDFGRCDQALMDIFLPESTVVHEPILARHPGGYGPDTRHQLELGFEISAMAYIKANAFRRDLVTRIDALFDDVDILICPTVAWVAPEADLSVIDDRGTIEMRFMAPWNLTGHPALTVPCGFAEDGLPAGLQVIGPRNADARLLRLAETWTGLMPLAAT
jgi:aspartyl-tRNA(Asn)/glutamyl-tRNA(Gln) amidotransferase subunit A